MKATRGDSQDYEKGGISETGSDIIPKSDKKRNKGASMNELGETAGLIKRRYND